jgi:hypothetical protein
MKTMLIILGTAFGILGVLTFGYNSFGLSVSFTGLFAVLLSLFETTPYELAARERMRDLSGVDLDSDDEEPIIRDVRRLRNLR